MCPTTSKNHSNAALPPNIARYRRRSHASWKKPSTERACPPAASIGEPKRLCRADELPIPRHAAAPLMFLTETVTLNSVLSKNKFIEENTRAVAVSAVVQSAPNLTFEVPTYRRTGLSAPMDALSPAT